MAAKLLARAGWVAGADGIVRKPDDRCELLLATDAQTALHRSESVLVQAALRRIGIDVEVKYFPLDILYAPQGMGGIMHGGKFDLLTLSLVRRHRSRRFVAVHLRQSCRRTAITTRAIAAARWTPRRPLALTRYDRASRKRRVRAHRTPALDRQPARLFLVAAAARRD